MRPCLSQVCCLAASFEDDVQGFADSAGDAIELWITKLEEFLKTGTLAQVKELAKQREQAFVAASYQGGLLVSQGEARRETWAQFQQRLDLLGELGVPTLVVVPDFHGAPTETDIERAQVSLKQAGQLAAARNIRLAVEFQARQPFLNNVETAASFVASVDEPNVGLCLDLFHFYAGPSKFEDLACLSPANLFHVQVCDVMARPRELMTDSERILPGDGDFQVGPILAQLVKVGYSGYVSLELMNPQFWPIAPRQVGEIGLTALRMQLGQASGGVQRDYLGG
jgi:2-keto-myo-inositol isomerase